jgi:hypothetical protein
MKPVVLLGVVLALLKPASADQFEDDLGKLTAGLPQDAVAVVTRRVMCNHWTGEEPYDKARAREIARAVKQNKCNFLEGDEAAVRQRYPKDPEVIKALNDAQDF